MSRMEYTPEQMEKIRATRAKWAREWRRKNPEAWKRIVDRYWLKKANALIAQEQARKDAEKGAESNDT